MKDQSIRGSLIYRAVYLWFSLLAVPGIDYKVYWVMNGKGGGLEGTTTKFVESRFNWAREATHRELLVTPDKSMT